MKREGNRENGCALEQKLQGIETGALRDGVRILGDCIDNGVEHGEDRAVREGFGVVFAVDKPAVCFGRRDTGGIAHVMLKRIVDVEVDVVHGGRRGVGRGDDGEAGGSPQQQRGHEGESLEVSR